PPCLDVLEHGGLVMPDLLCSCDATLERHAKLDAELCGDRLRLGHHGGRKLARRRELADVGEGSARKGADRIECEVAPELQPDLCADILEPRALEAGARETLRHALRALARRAIELADREAIAFDVLHHPGGEELARRVHDAAEHTLSGNELGERALRVDAAHDAAFERASMVEEV